MAGGDFWNHQDRARVVVSSVKSLKAWIEPFDKLWGRVEGALEMDVLLEGDPYAIVDNEFVKPGKGQALYKTRMRNLLTGRFLEVTYRSGDGLEAADIRSGDGSYSYFDGTNYIFMDNESFEQVELSAKEPAKVAELEALLDACEAMATRSAARRTGR